MSGELERRPDGWPLCPVCGEDELADLLNLYARADALLFCYRCGRPTVLNGRALGPSSPSAARGENT